MKKRLGEILVNILQKVSLKDILNSNAGYYLDTKLLKQIEFDLNGGYLSETEIDKQLEFYKREIPKELQSYGRLVEDRRDSVNKINVFELIEYLSDKLLVMEQGNLVYRYEKLWEWNYIGGKIGTNLLISTAYARRDIINQHNRMDFSWKTILNHDNCELNQILNKGLSENHFHLFASSPYFSLSWISLMNSVVENKQRNKLLNILQNQPRNQRKNKDEIENFEVLHLRAAVIRVYLYALLAGQKIMFSKYSVSMYWLLEHLYAKMNVYKLAKDMKVVSESQSKVEFVSDLFGDPLKKEMKQTYPDLYRFFVELYPYIPIDVLKEKDDLFSEYNSYAISDYIEREYTPMLLSDCIKLFSTLTIEEIEQEWDRQTEMEIAHMLKDTNYLRKNRNDIQFIIDGFHSGSKLEEKDYIMKQVVSVRQQENSVKALTGERWLLYSMMHLRCTFGKKDYMNYEKAYTYFFAYLVIKERFRMELVQNNDKVGFENFQMYQRRKSWFSSCYTTGEIAKIAVQSSFYMQNLKTLEIRVVPKDTCKDNILMIRYLDKSIGKIYKKYLIRNREDIYPYYYVFHFPKEKEELLCVKSVFSVLHRHENYIQNLNKKVMAIMKMREQNLEIANRLKGIDACSSEDGCRPEVFGVAFRSLKSHMVYYQRDGKPLNQLRVSYHVGEDNQDVLDGLRAIDEAICFLNLGSGDRLGHATLLGVDVDEWYLQRRNTISIRQQDYLDNVVWLYNKINQYHISNQDNVLEYLEREFHTYFNLIYEKAFDAEYMEQIICNRESYLEEKQENSPFSVNRRPIIDFNIFNFYNSWELRGDNPHLYRSGYYQMDNCSKDVWCDNYINKEVSVTVRRIPEAEILNYYYHYNNIVRFEGQKTIMITVPAHVRRGIKAIQKQLQKEIAKKGIAIETNPSSNVLIAGLKEYKKHPIVAFYNKDLLYDIQKEQECPQLNVSINTDDQGVFATCLRNEYTLMAGALEFAEDENGDRIYKKDKVYNWIENVRQMGNSQSFMNEYNLYCNRGE